MIKFVLNSGGVRKDEVKAQDFFTELVDGLCQSPRILISIFAKAREDWEQDFATWCNDINNYLGSEIKPEFELAMPDKFEDQVKRCEVVYFTGGDDHLLQYWLRKYDLKGLLEGKHVGTNSASSDAMADSFWPCDWRYCMKGLGLVPVKFIPHYESDWGEDDPRGPIDWQEAKAELARFSDPDLPIYALREGEYKTIIID